VESPQKSATNCPNRFQGQSLDEESGLHYNWNRYYEPETGRYLTADPIGLNGGTRSYGYVHNPLGWVDPFGLDPIQVDPNAINFSQRTGVQSNANEATYSHEGSVKQFSDQFGVKYDTPDAMRVSESQGWLKGTPCKG
jgi:RHS repeat-associated protein